MDLSLSSASTMTTTSSSSSAGQKHNSNNTRMRDAIPTTAAIFVPPAPSPIGLFDPHRRNTSHEQQRRSSSSSSCIINGTTTPAVVSEEFTSSTSTNTDTDTTPARVRGGGETEEKEQQDATVTTATITTTSRNAMNLSMSSGVSSLTKSILIDASLSSAAKVAAATATTIATTIAVAVDVDPLLLPRSLSSTDRIDVLITSPKVDIDNDDFGSHHHQDKNGENNDHDLLPCNNNDRDDHHHATNHHSNHQQFFEGRSANNGHYNHTPTFCNYSNCCQGNNNPQIMDVDDNNIDQQNYHQFINGDVRSWFRRNKNDGTIPATTTSSFSFLSNNNTYTTTTKEKEVAVPPDDTTVEDSLSQLLLKLSVKERMDTEEEIHGVRSSFKNETPELLNKALQEFDTELLKIKSSVSRSTIRNTPQDVLRYTVCISSTTISCRSQQQHQQDIDPSSSFLPPVHNDNNTNDNHDGDTNNSTGGKSTTTSSSRGIMEDNCYLNDPNVRLRFLRSEYFDPIKAVTRFVCFLEFTQELFGNFVAERSISIQDFSEEINGNDNSTTQQTERKVLLNSRHQYLDFRDRSGRRVATFVGSCLVNVPLKLRYKITMYLHWIASSDIESQQKGVVMIIWTSNEEHTTATKGRNYDRNGGTSRDDGWQTLRTNLLNHDVSYHNRSFRAIPIRIASVHFCASNNHPVYKVVAKLFYFGLPQEMHHLRSRFKTHFGEPIEIRYQLQSYGIPVDLLPMTYSGAVKTAIHVHSMKLRQQIESHYQHYTENYVQHHQRLRQVIYHNRKPVYGSESGQQEQGYLEGPPKKKTKKEMPMTMHYINKWEPGESKTMVAALSAPPVSQVPLPLQHELLVECPRSDDVIFRKGKQYGNHVGNSVLLSTLLDHTDLKYKRAKSSSEKTELMWRIVHEIESRGGRFLEWDGSIYNGCGAWVQLINDYKKCDKISKTYKIYLKQRQLQASRR